MIHNPSSQDSAKDDLVQLALSCGAARAVVLSRDMLVVSPMFRDICKSNSCGQYDRCWVCPPEIGEIDALIRSLDDYQHMLWYQSISPIEDSFDIEGMLCAGQTHAQLSQRLHSALKSVGLSGFLHLTCGGCHLCSRCAMADNLPCRHPEKALPSLEGYGVDVYGTTRHTPLPYINGQNTVTYFGAVLFMED